MVAKESTMSEQTTDTSNGLGDGAEPSMEDILASIRKIIADDEGAPAPVELKNELKTNRVEADMSSNLANTAATTSSNELETLDLDVLADIEPSESEIDSLIADMDMIDADVMNTPVVEDTLENTIDDIKDLEIPKDATTDIHLVAEEAVTEESLSSDDELSALLDDMMSENDEETDDFNETPENLELVVDPAQDLLADDFDLEADLNTDSPNSESDMDLVKSLMADLTGAPLHDDIDALEDLDVTEELSASETDALQEQEEDIFEALGLDLAEETDNTEVEADGSEANADDVMDEILSLTLDDEIEIQDNALEAADIDVPMSLKDIAAQAEADAEALSGGKVIAAAAAMGAVAAVTQDNDEADMAEEEFLETAGSDEIDDMLAKLDDMDTNEPDLEVEQELDIETELDVTPEIKLENTTELNPTEENSLMPRASKKDTIIDEVTETATADVFSSLNKVVEEKAVVAERGDRIGDLVMEALRPMLKDWLDANLKGIVERAVTKEVKRISSGK